MRMKLAFVAGAAVGYVLGARAGRGRYDQLKHQADALWHDPRVQQTVSAAGATVKEKGPEVTSKVAEAAGHATAAAKTKLAQVTASDDGPDRPGDPAPSSATTP